MSGSSELSLEWKGCLKFSANCSENAEFDLQVGDLLDSPMLLVCLLLIVSLEIIME